jgi:hypothetical protein
MRVVRIVELRVRANAPNEMTFSEHDQVIGQLVPKRPDEPLGVGVLPRRTRRDLNLTDPEVLDTSVEGGTEDFVSVANEELELTVRTKGLDDLLRSLLGVRVGRDVHM